MSIGSGVFIFPCFTVREMGNNTSAVFYELPESQTGSISSGVL